MKNSILLALLFLSISANGQYFKLALTDNSIPDEYLSASGFSYEFGFGDHLSDWFLVDYGVRYSQADVGKEQTIKADYISFLINPKAYVSEGTNFRFIAGAIFRLGGGVDKTIETTYLQAWNGLEVGMEFKGVELTGMFEISSRSGVYRGANRMKIFSLGLAYRLK